MPFAGARPIRVVANPGKRSTGKGFRVVVVAEAFRSRAAASVGIIHLYPIGTADCRLPPGAEPGFGDLFGLPGPEWLTWRQRLSRRSPWHSLGGDGCGLSTRTIV